MTCAATPLWQCLQEAMLRTPGGQRPASSPVLSDFRRRMLLSQAYLSGIDSRVKLLSLFITLSPGISQKTE